MKNEVKLIKVPSTKLKNLVQYQVLGLSGIEWSKYHPGCEGDSGQIFPNKASEKLFPLKFIFMPGEF